MSKEEHRQAGRSQLQDAISRDLADFQAWYSGLEAHFELLDLSASDKAYLASGIDNRDRPVHRWYNLKEAFSSNLPLWVLERIRKEYQRDVLHVLDPFLGGGTTGVTLAQEGINVTGLEYNPFIRFVAEVKADYPRLRYSSMEQACRNVRLSSPSKPLPVPDLSTFRNEKYFRPRDIQIMLEAARQVHELDCDRYTRKALLLGIAAAIEDVANLRKDGRALRFTKKVGRPQAEEAIKVRWTQILEDIGKLRFSGQFKVYAGSAIDLSHLGNDRTYDLIMYSPPYLNNFDYSEVYKLELWLLDFVKTKEDWRSLRQSTIRSHPSIQFTPTNHLDRNPAMHDIREQLARLGNSDCLVDSRTKRDMKPIIEGYFDDMYLALSEQWQLLKPGGFLVYIVANSRHKSLPIATDVILGEIARRIGFEPLEISILKKRNGRTRQKQYLRETAVFMRKP